MALVLLLFGAYLLTMSGHTYSPDEETMLLTSRALVTQGSWAQPKSRALVQVIGADGRRYSQYGPGQSLVAVPWVAAGLALGNLFPDDQAEFVLRLILGSYNALVTAGICGLFMATGLTLGYSRRASLLTALALAFSTFLWPHGRTFFSEPLVALCLLASFYFLVRATFSGVAFLPPRSSALAVLSGVLFAAAVATKVQYVVALLAFLVYLGFIVASQTRVATVSASLPLPDRWRIALRPALWWLLGLGIGIAPLLLYNLAIFGNPFSTGYGSDFRSTFKTPLYEGVFGLLFSSGKGILWYAPTLLLSLWGFGDFARKRRAEAAFVATLAVSLVIFFGLYAFWPGDGSWGPRYLIPLLPFAMLPMLAAVKKAMEHRTPWRRMAVTALVVLGFLVNLPGALVNFDKYINVVNEETLRYWYPDSSPIAGHGTLLGQRASEWSRRLNPQPGTIYFKQGFSYSEGDKSQGELLPRWTTGTGTLEIIPSGDNPLYVTLRLADHRPPGLPRSRVRILVDGNPVELEIDPATGQRPSVDYHFFMPPDPTTIVIESETWNPSEIQEGGRDEKLGVRLEAIAITENGQPRDYALVEATAPPSYYPQPRWYYDPATHHPADLWAVYMAETGMSRRAMLALALPIALISLTSILIGWLVLRRHL
jgi:hypothetical protein